jgi:hypothetical protein
MGRAQTPEVRIQQRESKRDCVPRRGAIVRHVSGRFDETIDDLGADCEDPPNPKIEWQEILAGLPVENILRLGPHEPAVTELIRNEGLKKQCIRRAPGNRNGRR